MCPPYRGDGDIGRLARFWVGAGQMTLKIDEAFLERLGWATLPTWTERDTGAGKSDSDDEAIVIDIRDAEVIDLRDAGAVSGKIA